MEENVEKYIGFSIDKSLKEKREEEFLFKKCILRFRLNVHMVSF